MLIGVDFGGTSVKAGVVDGGEVVRSMSTATRLDTGPAEILDAIAHTVLALTPKPEEFPSGVAKPPPFEYDKLLGDIAALRSRVAALTTTLFASKLRVVVETKGDDARLASFNITLDDGVVFAAPDRFSAEDERVVYEHAVAPGHHVVGVEIERYDARNKEFRTWQSSRFSVVIPESKLVDAHLKVIDDSDMADDFPSDADGEYDLRVKLRARVVE